ALGTLLAAAGTRAFMAFVPPTGLPIAVETRLDAPSLAFALAATLATGLLFGLAPALHATRPELGAVLREEAGTQAGSRRRAVVRRVLLPVEAALGAPRRAGAALSRPALRAPGRARLGFDADRLLFASVDLQGRVRTPQQGIAFWRALLERVRARSGA